MWSSKIISSRSYTLHDCTSAFGATSNLQKPNESEKIAILNCLEEPRTYNELRMLLSRAVPNLINKLDFLTTHKAIHLLRIERSGRQNDLYLYISFKKAVCEKALEDLSSGIYTKKLGQQTVRQLLEDIGTILNTHPAEQEIKNAARAIRDALIRAKLYKLIKGEELSLFAELETRYEELKHFCKSWGVDLHELAGNKRAERPSDPIILIDDENFKWGFRTPSNYPYTVNAKYSINTLHSFYREITGATEEIIIDLKSFQDYFQGVEQDQFDPDRFPTGETT